MKILLTGAEGNLGSEIIKCNNNNLNITNINRAKWGSLDNILTEKFDVVIHAAYDLKNRLSDSPTAVILSNVTTTTQLLEKMKYHEIPRLVFISSCAVYGESMKTAEEVPCYPISINGIIKLLNEKIIEEYCTKNNIKYEIYRIFNMYGGNDNFSIFSHIKKALQNNKEFNLNNHGISQRDFIHVEDVAKIIIKLIQTDHTYTHLNIGTGIATRISELTNMIQQKYPALKIKSNAIHEAEYSRGDITKLTSILGDYQFIDIKDFVKELELK